MDKACDDCVAVMERDTTLVRWPGNDETLIITLCTLQQHWQLCGENLHLLTLTSTEAWYGMMKVGRKQDLKNNQITEQVNGPSLPR